ncbi:MAG: BrnA antitoxin family protein [Acidiferrobacter sp.]
MKAHYDLSKARRGAVVPAAPTKTRITIRLDEDILAWFRNQVNEAGGGNYQSLINEVLREHIGQGAVAPLEETLRRVIREEIQRAE